MRLPRGGCTHVLLDFGDIPWVDPIYATPLATAVQRLRSDGIRVDVDPPRDPNVANYVRTIGFPDGFTEPSRTGKTYLPLVRLDDRGNASTVDVAGSTIRTLVKQLLDASGSVINGVYLPIGEILDNVEQHSNCSHGFASVQYYPNDDRIDLCIVDDGISIPGNFERHGIEFESDGDAVRQAIEWGRSTKAERDAKGRRRGTGFRTVIKIVCDGLDGQVLVSSRAGSLYRNRTMARLDGLFWDGTVIFARLRVPSREFDYTEYIVT